MVQDRTSGIKEFTLYLIGKVILCLSISESCKSLRDMKPDAVASIHLSLVRPQVPKPYALSAERP